jgi:hypothetical protein
MATTRDPSYYLDRRKDEEADIIWARYVRPYGDRGLHVVQLLSNDQEIEVGAAAGDLTFQKGAIVALGNSSGDGHYFIISEPPAGRRGAGGFSINQPLDVIIESVGIDYADPATVTVGLSNQLVHLIGWGFKSSPVDQFTAKVYDEFAKGWVADPNVTIHGVAFISDEEVTVLVDVTSAVPDDYPITIVVEPG